jgi:hypothetical protein
MLRRLVGWVQARSARTQHLMHPLLGFATRLPTYVSRYQP